MRPLGLAVIAASCLAPLIWLPAIAAGRDVVALFSQYLGMLALIVMALAQVIATRAPGVEAIFGAMDQSYRVHKWLGIAGLTAVLLHDTIDADMRGLGAETLLTEAAETAGEISLYGLLILVVITIATFIPYHLWKWTHRLIGVFFVLSAGHYLFILKPFSNVGSLGLYMAAFCAVGVLAYAYTSAPRGMRPSRRYRIEKVERQGQAIAVSMTPEGRPLRHHAGQFAFFAFQGAGFDEPHPFTISAGPQMDGALRVTIAPLGDLTMRLVDTLAPEQSVRVDGPYGRFGRVRSGPQVWIAAGVGVTPFVALAEALPSDGAPVEMIYSVASREGAAHADLLREIAAANPRFNLTIWNSATKARLTAGRVAELSSIDLTEANVLFCGPVAMRKKLGDHLRRRGVPPSCFQFEEFEIRTGIGLRALFTWLWRKRKSEAS